MTDFFNLSQFGIAIFAVGALVFVICRFLEFMHEQERSFKNTIDNHLDSELKLHQKQLEANKDLHKAVAELLTFLRYHNKKT